MSYCEKCGINNACERTDLVGNPVLCDACWLSELLGDCDCDRCFNGYYEGDRLRCDLEKCQPRYT